LRAVGDGVGDDAHHAVFVRDDVILGDDVQTAPAARTLAVDLRRV